MNKGETDGYVISPEELPSPHDVFLSLDDPGPKKASYIVQFLWRDLTSSYDLIGPYFTVAKSINTGFILEQLTLVMYVLDTCSFRTIVILCNRPSSNLAAMKIICGLPNTTMSGEVEGPWQINVHFFNPYDSANIPVFVIICPTHQVINMSGNKL